MTDHEPLESALRAQLATLRVADDPAAADRMTRTATASAAGHAPHGRRLSLAPLAAAAAVVAVAGGVTLLATGSGDGPARPAANGSSTPRAVSSARPSATAPTTPEPSTAVPSTAAPSATASSSAVAGAPTTFTLHLDVPVGRARTVEHAYDRPARQFTVLGIHVVDPRRDIGILDVSGGSTFVLKSYRLQDVRNRDLRQTDLIHVVRGAPLQVSIECTSAPTGRCEADVRITGYVEPSYPATASPTESPSGGVTATTLAGMPSTAPSPPPALPTTRSTVHRTSVAAGPSRSCTPATAGSGC